MPELHALTLFYTARIGGDLHLLPQLYTFLMQLAAKQPRKPLLLDIGESCSPEVWPCEVTGGRSTLIVLDGMGYHAANAEGVLAEGERYKLQGATSMGVVDARYSWRYDVPPIRDEDIVISLLPEPTLHLNIVLQGTDATTLSNRTLRLQQVDKRQVGIVEVNLTDEPRLVSMQVVAMPSGLRPDPTISAAVDFVEDEARYLESRR